MVAYCYDEELIKDFLRYVSDKHFAVLVDISRPDIEHRRIYKYINQSDVLKEYLESKEEDA